MERNYYTFQIKSNFNIAKKSMKDVKEDWNGVEHHTQCQLLRAVIVDVRIEYQDDTGVKICLIRRSLPKKYGQITNFTRRHVSAKILWLKMPKETKAWYSEKKNRSGQKKTTIRSENPKFRKAHFLITENLISNHKSKAQKFWKLRKLIISLNKNYKSRAQFGLDSIIILLCEIWPSQIYL